MLILTYKHLLVINLLLLFKQLICASTYRAGPFAPSCRCVWSPLGGFPSARTTWDASTGSCPTALPSAHMASAFTKGLDFVRPNWRDPFSFCTALTALTVDRSPFVHFVRRCFRMFPFRDFGRRFNLLDPLRKRVLPLMFFQGVRMPYTYTYANSSWVPDALC